MTKDVKHGERIEDFTAWLYENTGMSRGTIKAYGKAMLAVLRAGGDPYDYLRGDYAPSYRQLIAATLRHWARHTNDTELAAKLEEGRTTRLVKKPQQEPKARKAALTSDELDAFLDALAGRDEPPWSRPCLGLMARLGLRSNDMLRLSRHDVEAALDADRLRVVGKGEKARWLPTAPVEDDLRELMTIDKHWTHLWDLVAPETSDPDNRPEYAYNMVWREVREVARLAGVENMSTHRLRKGVARRLYERSGGSIADVSRILGHANPQTTLIYLEEDLDAYIARSGDLLGRD